MLLNTCVHYISWLGHFMWTKLVPQLVDTKFYPWLRFGGRVVKGKDHKVYCTITYDPIIGYEPNFCHRYYILTFTPDKVFEAVVKGLDYKVLCTKILNACVQDVSWLGDWLWTKHVPQICNTEFYTWQILSSGMKVTRWHSQGECWPYAGGHKCLTNTSSCLLIFHILSQ